MGVVTGGGGGAAFNGGTITNPLGVTPPGASATALTLTGSTGSSALGTDGLEVLDEFGTTAISLQYDGGCSIAVQDTSSSFNVKDATSGVTAIRMQVQAAGAGPKLGFFGHATGAQPTLTSGTTTPELIALALQSLGLTGGT